MREQSLIALQEVHSAQLDLESHLGKLPYDCQVFFSGFPHNRGKGGVAFLVPTPSMTTTSTSLWP
eukprot:2000767-Pyramimonas_sp.AAC.1